MVWRISLLLGFDNVIFYSKYIVFVRVEYVGICFMIGVLLIMF